jgi:hypothetical protein
MKVVSWWQDCLHYTNCVLWKIMYSLTKLSKFEIILYEVHVSFMLLLTRQINHDRLKKLHRVHTPPSLRWVPVLSSAHTRTRTHTHTCKLFCYIVSSMGLPGVDSFDYRSSGIDSARLCSRPTPIYFTDNIVYRNYQGTQDILNGNSHPQYRND